MTQRCAGTLFAIACLAAAMPAQKRAGLTPEHARALDALQPKINAAIDKGVDYLLSRQHRDGSWGYENERFATGQTALATYALLKCSLPPEHASVRRAIAHFRTIRPTMVYATGCQLLALGATHLAEHHTYMRSLVEDLEDWQDGTWGYPNPRGHVPGLHSDRDLSITQFAVLGFRAAHQVGVQISIKATRTAFDDTLRYQNKPRQRDGREIAGYRYHWASGGAATGSMTTAGIASTNAAAEMLGKKLGGKRRRLLDRANERALAWLDAHYQVAKNPGRGDSWRYYYLYGLERTGSLLGTEYIGDHPWYLDGAKLLVDQQKGDGSWNQNNAEADTCFALLFLERATAPTTGRSSRTAAIAFDPDPKAELGIQGVGGVDGSPLRIWLSHIGVPEPNGARSTPVRIAKVEYLIDGEPFATRDVDPTRLWRGDAHAAEHRFDGPGKHKIGARVHVVDLGSEGGVVPSRVISAPEVEIEVDWVLEDWMLHAAEAGLHNLLPERKIQVTASSGADSAARAIDRNEATAWLFKPDEANPTISLRFGKSVAANTLRLSQVGGQRSTRGHHDHVRKVAIRVNRDDELEAELADNPLAPTWIPLRGKGRIKQIEIRILDRTRGSRHPGVGGFAEIGFEKR